MSDKTKQTIEEDAKKHRKEETKKLTVDMLGEMLKKDLKFFHTHYIKNRSLQILNETLDSLKYSHKEIEKARRAFLDVLIDGANKKIYGLKEEKKRLRKGVKSEDKEIKKKAKEGLKRIERIEKGEPKDKTEERDMQCEPICQMIVKRLLDKDLLLSNDKYIKSVIEFDNDLLLRINSGMYAEEFFTQLYDSIDASYSRATEKLYGKSRFEITLGHLDNILKDTNL